MEMIELTSGRTDVKVVHVWPAELAAQREGR
jgi:hypothetical protein